METVEIRIAPYCAYTLKGGQINLYTNAGNIGLINMYYHAIKDAIDEVFKDDKLLLFGEYEPNWARPKDDPCFFNTIHHENCSHRIIDAHFNKHSTLFADVVFIPGTWGDKAAEWYRRDPNHLVLVPRIILNNDDFAIKQLITLDLKVVG